LKSVYGASDPRKCPGKKTAKEIAEIIIKAGVTPKSIIIVWHKSTVDLDLLRELLESAGRLDILPPEASCIPMMKHFRAGLPRNPKTGKTFTAKLDVLFPILFAGHKLVGKSHRALPDTQMLRLLVLLLVQLQKPPQDRDLRGFSLTTQEFVGYGRAPRTDLEKWLGVGFTMAPDSVPEAQGAEVIIDLSEDADDEDDDDDEEEEEEEEGIDDEIEAEIELEMQEYEVEMDIGNLWRMAWRRQVSWMMTQITRLRQRKLRQISLRRLLILVLGRLKLICRRPSNRNPNSSPKIHLSDQRNLGPHFIFELDESVPDCCGIWTWVVLLE
jgi:hypothetical protein